MGSIAEIAARRVYHDAYIASYPQVIAERRDVLLQRRSARRSRRPARLLVDADLAAAVRLACSVPTHVIYGELDQATPPPLNRAIAERIPGATIRMIPACGHCPPLEAPDAFLQAVGDVLG